MKYKLINESEHYSITIKELDRLYCSKGAGEINLLKCDIYKRGKYWVIQYENKVFYYEYHSTNYPFFEMALLLMSPGEFAAWKTVENLISFRMAIREDVVNGRGLLEMIGEKLQEETYVSFMLKSREADLLHHAQSTF